MEQNTITAPNNGSKAVTKPKQPRRTCGIPMAKALTEMPLVTTKPE